MPRTDDGAVFERALRQRTSKMGTRMRERTDASALAHQQHVGVPRPCTDHAVVRERCACEDRREVLWEFLVRVGDADTLSIHEVAAEIRRSKRDCVPCPGARPSAAV